MATVYCFTECAGVDETIKLMKDRELKVSGYELLLVLKANMSDFVKKHANMKAMPLAETSMMTDGPTDVATPTLEALQPILEQCEQCFVANVAQGNLSYYFVNGKLLGNVRGCVEVTFTTCLTCDNTNFAFPFFRRTSFLWLISF